MEVYILYMTTYMCKQRVVALLLMELLSMSKMRKMRTITPPDANNSILVFMITCQYNNSCYSFRQDLVRHDIKNG